MSETTWRQLGGVWIISHLSAHGPASSGHIILSAAQALALAKAIIRANEPRDEDVADVMEAG